MAQRVLIVHSDPQSGQPLIRYFRERGDDVLVTDQLSKGQAWLEQRKPDILFLDLHFPGKEWLTLLRQARAEGSPVKVILTNRFPDLQRELLAGEHGANVILRQPFTQRWIEAALRRLEQAAQAEQKPISMRLPPVRLPVGIKITIPYLLLALLFALASAYVITQIAVESVQDRYLNQLIETGRQAGDWLVREEQRLLSTERLAANTQGLAQAILDQDAEKARTLAFPVAVNNSEEAIEVVDLQGISLVSMHKKAGGGAGEYDFSRGDGVYGQQPFVRSVLLGQTDAAGDKFAGIIGAENAAYFYVAGPVISADNKVVGALLVGKTLKTLASQAGQETFADISLYDARGSVLNSTFTAGEAALGLSMEQVVQVLNDKATALTRTMDRSAAGYTEILGPWVVRNRQDFGVIGTALPQNFLVRTSSGIQMQVFLIVAISILLVIFIGILLATRITRPLVRLVRASGEIAQGNLEIKVDSTGNDEMAVLASSFNYMVVGLQEGSVYRDLLGRTVSPEVRDQLRQTFTSGGLRLEGQEAVASVLMMDIRGFTTLSEKTDPATVLSWLNEYFGRLVPIVQSYGGVVNKFDGDAMLAFFGILPRRLSPQNGAQAACQVALEMLKAIDELNAQRANRGDPPLVSGIGINTGVVIAGGLGTSDRLHYTIIGDTVNTTQRLESLTRQLYETSGIVVGHSTVSALAEAAAEFQLEPAGMHAVKGKMEQVQVYRLLPKAEPAKEPA